MAKTETQIDLKINKGTYAKIQENLSQIGEDELIITTDKNIPVPTSNDNGNILYVSNGEYVLGEGLNIEVVVQQLGEGTTTISLTQDQETMLLDHSKKPMQIIVRIGTERYVFYKQIETETVERYICITPTTSALYSYMLQYTKQSGELVLYDSKEIQFKIPIIELSTNSDLATSQQVLINNVSQDDLNKIIANKGKSLLLNVLSNNVKYVFNKINEGSSYGIGTRFMSAVNDRDILIGEITNIVGTVGHLTIKKINFNIPIISLVGSTITDEQKSIINNNDNIIVSLGYNGYYIMQRKVNNSYAQFYALSDNLRQSIIRIDLDAKTWTNSIYDAQDISYKVDTIEGYESSPEYYPTTSAVYNFIVFGQIVDVSLQGIPDLTQTYTFTLTLQERQQLSSLGVLHIHFVVYYADIAFMYIKPQFVATSDDNYILHSSSFVSFNNQQVIANVSIDLSLQSNNATLSFSEIEGGGGSQASEQFTKIKLHTQSTVTIPDPNKVEPDRTETLTQYWTAIIPKSNEAIIIANANALLQESFTTLDELFTYLNTAITSSGSTDSTMIGMYDMMIRLIMGLTTFKFEVNFDYVDTYDTPVENTTQYGLDTEIDNATIKVYIGFQNLSNLGNYIEITPDKIFQIEYSNYSFGSGSSTGGGSGKLYEWDLALERYDENGDVVRYSYNTSPTDNNLYLSLLIYESNFERFKASAQQYGLSINQPSDLTAFINNSFDESIGSTSQTTLGILLTLVTQADKVLLLMGNMQSEVTADTTGLLISLNTWQPLQFFNDSSGTNIFYGLNCNNSCTLTEYGTSGGSSSSQPSIPERFSLAYNLVVNINQEQFANGSWTGDNTSNIRTFQYNGSNADQAKATELVEFLTGVPVLDEYNATKPTPCFVFCTQSNICWKLQWESNGLKAYQVNNFPFVVKKKYYNFVLQDSDGANSLSLQINIPYETMQDVYDSINQVLGGNISTPQEVIAVYDSLKADNIQSQQYGMLIQLFGGLAQYCLYYNLSNIIGNMDGAYKVTGASAFTGILYNGNNELFSITSATGKISFTSNSTLVINEYDSDRLD